MCTLILSLDDTPTQQQLTQLDVPDLNLFIRIKDSISDYVTVGTFLLNDEQGVIMDEIRDDHKSAKERKHEVFKRWIRGVRQKGREKSNTWGMLVRSLKVAEENDLADKIESVIEFCEDQSTHRDKKCKSGNAQHNVIQEKSTETVLISVAIVGATVILGAAVTVIICCLIQSKDLAMQ